MSSDLKASEMDTPAYGYDGSNASVYGKEQTKQDFYNSQVNLNNASELGSDGYGRVELGAPVNESGLRHEMA